MAYSTASMHTPTPLSFKSNASANFGKRKRKVVCRCPWSGSDMEPKKDSYTNKKYEIRPENHFPFNLITKQVGPGRKLPPGPSLLDLMGQWHHLVRSVPYHYPLRDLANTYGPLMHIQLGELSLIVVSSSDMAKEVLKTHDIASAGRPRTMTGEVMCYDYSDILFSPYGQYWREMRKVCSTELLGAKSVRSLEHIRENEASALIHSIQSSGGTPFNLTEKVVLSIGSMLSRALFGKMAADEGAVGDALGRASVDRDAVIRSVKKATHFAGNLYLADLFPSVEAFGWISVEKLEMWNLRRDTEKILEYVIDEHRKKMAMTGQANGELGNEDFVDVLLRLKSSDDLDISITDDNIKAVISDMAVGGSETVLTTIDWTMAELMKNPRVMAKAQNEIRQAFKGKKRVTESGIRTLKYLNMVVKETLRLHPPNCIIPRACREEFEVDGYHIPLNSIILVNVWAIGRDPNYWRNPSCFKPERFEESPVDYSGTHFELIPFGAGKRMCPAIAFSMSYIEFILAHLLYNFDWKLPPGISIDDLDMTETDGSAVSRKSNLYLIARPYHHG